MTFDEHENGQMRLGVAGEQLAALPLPNDQIPTEEPAGDELGAILEQRARDAARRQELERKAPRGFDPAALFLLELAAHNLYDPTPGDEERFTCRGCGATVNRRRRGEHHAAHRRTYNQKGAGKL